MAASVADAALGAAQHDLQQLRSVGAAARLSGAELASIVTSRQPQEPIVVLRTVEVPVRVEVQPAQSQLTPAPVVSSAAPVHAAPEDDIDEETAAAEIRRLSATVHEMTEVNDRIMAQNISLLADLEAAQRAVREARADKDALALQLKAALLRLQATGGVQ